MIDSRRGTNTTGRETKSSVKPSGGGWLINCVLAL